MAALPTQVISSAGLLEVMSAASAGGDVMDPGCFLRIANGGASSINVTIPCQVACSYGSGTPTHDKVVAVAAGAVRDIKVERGQFTRSSDGKIVITYSAVTSVTVAALSHS